MKAYRVEMIVVDFENHGEAVLRQNIDQMRYYAPDIIAVEEADIGEWSDDHPLNCKSTLRYEKRAYFEKD